MITAYKVSVHCFGEADVCAYMERVEGAAAGSVCWSLFTFQCFSLVLYCGSGERGKGGECFISNSLSV